jgi:5-methylcytosine-specific restriction protein A
MKMKKLGRLIESLSELLDNLKQVDAYLMDDNDGYCYQMAGLIARGRDLVVYKTNSKLHFAPSRFVGYLNNDLITHFVEGNGKHGTKTTQRIDKILGYHSVSNDELDNAYFAFCNELDVIPTKHQKKYWILNKEQNDQYSNEYYEGNAQQVLVNRYERNPQARKECIEKFGCKCQICGIDFEKVYGEIGKGFIHVHHITPISDKKGKTHLVNPKINLIPVCPNCHAMLHRGKLSIEELKTIINK